MSDSRDDTYFEEQAQKEYKAAEITEVKLTKKQLSQLKSDGLIHTDSGRLFDPVDGHEIGGESSNVQLQDHPMSSSKDDRYFEDSYQKDQLKEKTDNHAKVLSQKEWSQVNKFDGLIHAKNGKIIDPLNGNEIDEMNDVSDVALYDHPLSGSKDDKYFEEAYERDVESDRVFEAAEAKKRKLPHKPIKIEKVVHELTQKEKA